MINFDSEFLFLYAAKWLDDSSSIGALELRPIRVRML